MKRFLVATFVAMLVNLTATMVSAAPIYRWSHVGQNPMCDSVEAAVNNMEVSAELKADLVALIKKGTIDRQELLGFIRDASVAEAEKNRMREAIAKTCFKFFAIEDFEGELRLTPEVLARVRDRVTKTYEEVTLRPGDQFAGMAFGSPVRVVLNVAWEPRRGEPPTPMAHLYTATRGNVTAKVVLPLGCKNLAYGWKIFEGPPLSVAMPPLPDKVRTWQVNLFSMRNSTKEGREILKQLRDKVRGKQSIDLDEAITEAIAKKLIAFYEPCVSVGFEWFDLEPGEIQKDTVWISEGKSKVKAIVQPVTPEFALDACGGSGAFKARIKPKWARLTMSYAVTLPASLPLAYPKSHELVSCGPATRERCRAAMLEPTISFQHSQRVGVTDLYVVVNDGE